MTVQNDAPPSSPDIVQRKAPPEIEREEDIPFEGISGPCLGPRPSNLSKADSLDDQITRFKYMTGRRVLFVSMGAMGIAVLASIILSIFEIDNPLLENAFEVFKLIAMTVLGYIFGSKTK